MQLSILGQYIPFGQEAEAAAHDRLPTPPGTPPSAPGEPQSDDAFIRTTRGNIALPRYELFPPTHDGILTETPDTQESNHDSPNLAMYTAAGRTSKSPRGYDVEVFVKGAKVTWTQGGVLRKVLDFSSENETIQQTLFAWFIVNKSTHTKPSVDQEREDGREEDNDADDFDLQQQTSRSPGADCQGKQQALVIILKETARVYFASGESHSVHLPFEVHRVWPMDLGLLMERRTQPEEDLESSMEGEGLARFYMIMDPFNEFQVVTLYRLPQQIEPSISLSQEDMPRIRHLSGTVGNIFNTCVFLSHRDVRDRTVVTFDLVLKRHRIWRYASSMPSALPFSKLQTHETVQDSMAMDIDLDADLQMRTDTYLFEIESNIQEASPNSTIFSAHALDGSTVICILDQVAEQLLCYQIIADQVTVHLWSTPAVSAIAVEATRTNQRDVLKLTADGSMQLWTGYGTDFVPCQADTDAYSQKQKGGTRTSFKSSARDYLLGSLKTKGPLFKPSNRIIEFRDAVEDRVSLVLNDATILRTRLDFTVRSSLVQECLDAITFALPVDLLWDFKHRFLRLQFSKEPQYNTVPATDEWGNFATTLLSYCDPSLPKKPATTESDWDFLLNSEVHRKLRHHPSLRGDSAITVESTRCPYTELLLQAQRLAAIHFRGPSTRQSLRLDAFYKYILVALHLIQEDRSVNLSISYEGDLRPLLALLAHMVHWKSWVDYYARRDFSGHTTTEIPGRNDLAELKSDQAPGYYMRLPSQVKKDESTKRQDIHSLCEDVVQQDGEKELETTGTEITDSEITDLRFGADRRVSEAQHMLQSSVVLKIKPKDEPDLNEDDLKASHQEALRRLAQRTMALPVGRAILTFGTVSQIVDQHCPIPPIMLSAKLLPTYGVTDLDSALLGEHTLDWPNFHNGVAAGLRFSSNSTGVKSSWITFNKPQVLDCNHAGFLFALGLTGHLRLLVRQQVFHYLSINHEMTAAGLLLGLACAHRGTMNPAITRILSLHVPALLQTQGSELSLTALTQVVCVLGIGLLYMGTANRRMAEGTLAEIGANSGGVMDPGQGLQECHSVAAGFALGFITLGQGDNPMGLRDMKIVDVLVSYMPGSTDKNHGVKSLGTDSNPQSSGIDQTSAGATVAMGLMYLKTNNRSIAAKLSVPETQFLLDYVNPYLLMLRVICRAIVLWDSIVPTRAWILSQIPDYLKDVRTGGPPHTESGPQSYYSIIAGACFALGLRFAGSGNEAAYACILSHMDKFLDLGRATREMMTPCLLPELSTISQIEIQGPRYWPITLDLSSEQEDYSRIWSILRARSISVMRHTGHLSYTEDPLGMRGILARPFPKILSGEEHREITEAAGSRKRKMERIERAEIRERRRQRGGNGASPSIGSSSSSGHSSPGTLVRQHALWRPQEQEQEQEQERRSASYGDDFWLTFLQDPQVASFASYLCRVQRGDRGAGDTVLAREEAKAVYFTNVLYECLTMDKVEALGVHVWLYDISNRLETLDELTWRTLWELRILTNYYETQVKRHLLSELESSTGFSDANTVAGVSRGPGPGSSSTRGGGSSSSRRQADSGMRMAMATKMMEDDGSETLVKISRVSELFSRISKRVEQAMDAGGAGRREHVHHQRQPHQEQWSLDRTAEFYFANGIFPSLDKGKNSKAGGGSVSSSSSLSEAGATLLSRTDWFKVWLERNDIPGPDMIRSIKKAMDKTRDIWDLDRLSVAPTLDNETETGLQDEQQQQQQQQQPLKTGLSSVKSARSATQKDKRQGRSKLAQQVFSMAFPGISLDVLDYLESG
ncbi:Anaphase-promoting complex subunit 1 [Mortierella antarctica]|nr:Anaphase-promoting complex subunit 1 [Mortierella antarctica]